MALALLGVACGLGACADMVISPTPVVTAEESAQAPKLKPGFWAFDVCGDQRVRGRDFCADGYMISDSTLDPTGVAKVAPGAAAGGEPFKDPPFPYRLGVGDPLIMQVHLEENGPNGSSHALYVFVALDPKSSDDQGRIDRVEIWLVKCGPPAAPRPGDMGPRPTEHLFAGATATVQGCTPTDKSGLFSAARASRALPDKEVLRAVYRWMGERPPKHAAARAGRLTRASRPRPSRPLAPPPAPPAPRSAR